MPDILTFFRQAVGYSVAQPKAKFAESLDDLLGFSSIGEERCSEVDFPDATPDSWQRNLANYRSVAEYRLQSLSQSAVAFARKTFKAAAIPPGDSVCVRIIDWEYGSPFSRSLEGHHYVVIPSGFIKSLENIWRVHFSLATKGKTFSKVTPRLRSNEIGGASIERALTADFRNSSQYLESIFAHAQWGHWYEEPLAFREGVLRAGDRIGGELLNGLYSTGESPELQPRIPATRESRWLTRLVLAYVLAHEIAHVIFNAETTDRSESDIDVETSCDLFATLYYPDFIAHDSRGWAAARDGGIEHLVGMFGFFTAVQIRDTAGLIQGVQSKKISEGSRYAQIKSRMILFQRRAMEQIGTLSNYLGEEDLAFATGVLSEFQSLLVGIQMAGVRMLYNRTPSFGSFFERWNDELAGRMEEIACCRAARKRPGDEGAEPKSA